MKINDNYVLKTVLDSYIIVDISRNNNFVIKINETAKDIFECVNNGNSKEDIISFLINKYEIEKEKATKDVEDFIKQMIQKGICIDEQ